MGLVISPVSLYAAVLPGTFLHSGMSFRSCPQCRLSSHVQYRLAYSSVINVLDYTSVVIPVTFADKAVDLVRSDFAPLTEKDAQNMQNCRFLPQ